MKVQIYKKYYKKYKTKNQYRLSFRNSSDTDFS
jgi:hypothetical protein